MVTEYGRYVPTDTGAYNHIQLHFCDTGKRTVANAAENNARALSKNILVHVSKTLSTISSFYGINTLVETV